MTQKNLKTDAFISASTIITEDMENVTTNSENKNSEVYSCPELFY